MVIEKVKELVELAITDDGVTVALQPSTALTTRGDIAHLPANKMSSNTLKTFIISWYHFCMALTVTTDLTQITAADSLTGWTQERTSDTAETDYFVQGLGCVSLVYNSIGLSGSHFDIGAGNVLNFSTTHAGKLVYIWLRSFAINSIDTRANGGLRIVIGSGATAPAAAVGVWSAWYVDGSDTYVGTDGWKCYVIDPRKTPSTTFGGGVDLTACRWFGGAMKTVASVKGQPLGIDQIMYGFGELRARGTNVVAGAGFKEMVDADFGNVSNKYGITTEKEGVFYIQGRLVLGDSVSTNPTTFTSQNETLSWTYPVYYDGTREAPCMNDTRDDGTPYFGVYIVGNATTPAGDTSITFGAKVGTGDTASGRNGPVLIGSRQKTSLDGDDGQVETLLIYGTTFNRFRGGVDLSGNASTDEFIGNSVIGSGSVQAGPVQLRANTFVDNLGGTYTKFEDFINARATGAEALTTADPRYDWIVVLNGSNLSVPSASAGYVEVLDPGAGDRSEVVQISGDVVGSDNHFAEAIIRWPSAGTNQSALGVTIRGAAATTENYWYLKADLLNSLLSLISCATGTDTTVTSSAVTFAEDTDYIIHLYGNGTTIQGFCSGNGATTKLSTTSATYQTNRRVGIRADAEADQTSDAPRLSRFGAGPITNPLGAIVLASANDNSSYDKFINNARAYDLTTTGTYALTSDSLSGNMVDLRNDSGGSATVNLSSSSSPVAIENTASSATTLVSSVSVTITVLDSAGTTIPGVEVAIFQDNSARTIVLASTPTNEVGVVSTTAASSLGAIIIRARQSTNKASFLTNSSGIDGTTEVITTLANHNFRDGDGVTYSRNSGSQDIGPEPGAYYVNSISATTLSLHTTAANAIANTSRENLNTAGAETHLLDPIRYAAASTTGTVGTTNFVAQITLVTDSIATG